MLRQATLAATLLAGLSAPALAGTITPVGSRAALGGNDLIDWTQLPPSITVVPTPVSVVSDHGLGAVVTSPSGAVFSDQQGNPWAGNFAPGDRLVGTGQIVPSAPILITFADPVKAVGAQMGYDIISAVPFPFTETLDLFGSAHNLLASFSVPGFMDDAADNSAVFIGATDTVAEIASAEFFTPTTTGPVPGGFTINQVSLLTAVPEPASVVLLATGLLGALALRRRAKPPT